jgi:hypothetical protein
VVKWQGKMDVNGAVATWKKLLDTNPNYEGKQKVEELIAQAQKHSGVKPGTPAKPLSNWWFENSLDLPCGRSGRSQGS